MVYNRPFRVIQGGKASGMDVAAATSLGGAQGPRWILLADGANPQALTNMHPRDIPYSQMPIAATLAAGEGSLLCLGKVPQPTGLDVLANPRSQRAAYLLGQLVIARAGAQTGPRVVVNADSVRQAARVGEVAEKYPSRDYPGMTKRGAVLREAVDYVDGVRGPRDGASPEGRAAARALWDEFDRILTVMGEEGLTPYDLYRAALERAPAATEARPTPLHLKPGHAEGAARPARARPQGTRWERLKEHARRLWNDREEDGFSWHSSPAR